LRNGSLTAAAYATALLLAAMPIIEAIATALPLSPRSTAWRLGAAGLLSRSLLLALLGMTLTAGLAAYMQHRRTLRALSIIAAMSSVVFLCAAGLFALDSIQMHSQVDAAARLAFRAATVIALVKFVAIGIVTALLSRGCWVAGRRSVDERHRRAGVTPALIGT